MASEIEQQMRHEIEMRRLGFTWSSTGRTLALLLSLLAFIISIASFAMAYKRSRLDYNPDGRYFDAEEMVVYHDSAVIGFEVLGVAAMGVALGMLGGWVLLNRWSARLGEEECPSHALRNDRSSISRSGED